MSYTDLRKAFHVPEMDEKALLDQRLNDPHTIHLQAAINGFPGFVCMVPEIYEAMLEASRLDKEILRLESFLPQPALANYRNSCLINEIVLTNEIEGVHSTRREIGEVLERLENNDRRGRFSGIVQKYALLQARPEIPIHSCEDIRSIYNDLVLGEVQQSDPSNVPDGKFFRTKTVHVVNEAGIPIHEGMEPEAKIIAEMEHSLALLDNEAIPPLVRIATFHFLFGYIHPFYDGNGRANRFISSYLITREYEPIVGLGISFAIKQEIEKYYKGFSLCEHPLNKGDITPFVIGFSEICVSAMHTLQESLTEKLALYNVYMAITQEVLPSTSMTVAEQLINATLFTFDGISAEQMGEAEGLSRQTVYKRLAPLKEKGLLQLEKVGRKTFYKLDEEAFLALAPWA